MSSASRLGGGVTASAKELINALGDYKDLELSVHCLGDKFLSKDGSEFGKVKIFGGASYGPSVFGYCHQSRKIITDFAPDILHLHGIWTHQSIAMYEYAMKNRIPYLISIHGMLDEWALKTSSFKKALARKFYQNKIISQASVLHSLCPAESFAIREAGFNNHILEVPNGVSTPNVEASYCRPNWPEYIFDDKKVLLYLGRIHPKKGLRNLVVAWNELSNEKNPFVDEWSLVVAGWSQLGYEDELKDIVGQYGLTKSIYFVGPQFGFEKSQSYYFADGFVLPSLSEGLPMVVLEAWAHCLPVIMTRECNFPDSESFGASIIFDSSVQGLKNALTSFHERGGSYRAKMGAQGFKLAKTVYSWQTVAKKMNATYRWVVNGAPPPDCIIRAY